MSGHRYSSPSRDRGGSSPNAEKVRDLVVEGANSLRKNDEESEADALATALGNEAGLQALHEMGDPEVGLSKGASVLQQVAASIGGDGDGELDLGGLKRMFAPVPEGVENELDEEAIAGQVVDEIEAEEEAKPDDQGGRGNDADSGGGDDKPGPYNPLMRKASGAGGQADGAAVQSLIQESSAKVLPAGVADDMQRVIGHDFGHVIVHIDAAAAEAAEMVGADAFAIGTHVFFGQGRFQPGTPIGDTLIAHELCHIVQYDNNQLRGSSTGDLEVSQPGERFETEAEQFAYEAAFKLRNMRNGNGDEDPQDVRLRDVVNPEPASLRAEGKPARPHMREGIPSKGVIFRDQAEADAIMAGGITAEDIDRIVEILGPFTDAQMRQFKRERRADPQRFERKVRRALLNHEPDEIVGDSADADKEQNSGSNAGAANSGNDAETSSGDTNQADQGSEQGNVDIKGADPRGVLSDSRLNPRVAAMAARTAQALLEEGFTPYVFEGYRSYARQESLSGGSTNAGGGYSYHQYGLAVDIIWMTENGQPSWTPSKPQFWDRVGALGLSFGFSEWGGNWSSLRDYPHLEYHPGGQRTSEIKKVYEASGSNRDTNVEAGNKAVWEWMGLETDPSQVGTIIQGATGWDAILAGQTTLRKGDKGGQVTELQTKLNAAGAKPELDTDGDFGSKTDTAVREFQAQNGLQEDGIVGPAVAGKLDEGGTFTGSGPSKDEPSKDEDTPAKEEDAPSGDTGPVPEGNVTSHFSWKEFACKDGTAVPQEYRANVETLAGELEVIREALGGAAITINSAYRSPAYNKKVGGVSNSQHLYARAADISVSGKKPSEVKRTIEDLIADKKIQDGGLGGYNTFTHYDVRGSHARWGK